MPWGFLAENICRRFYIIIGMDSNINKNQFGYLQIGPSVNAESLDPAQIRF